MSKKRLTKRVVATRSDLASTIAAACLAVFGITSGCCVGECNPSPSAPTHTGSVNSATPADLALADLPLIAVQREAHADERRFRNIEQLTFGGENAEAYFSPDGKQLIFQSKRPPYQCDQIFKMGIDGRGLTLVSTGKGRTTCAYFFYPDARAILYSSTHATDANCPPEPSRDQGYVWPLYASYDIYTARPDGTELKALTSTPGYDAEATMRRDGSLIVFTSVRDGDLELYSMKADGSDVRRLTNKPGYDGGAFFSHDGKKLCYRAYHPEGAELEDYRALLARGLVRPNRMEIWVMDADGSNARQLTSNGNANFCPYFTPDDQAVVYSSNQGGNPREFDLYLVRLDGTGQERVTYTAEFDGFPMFSPDGKKIVWASNRHSTARGETNIFIADWKN
ncbi:MAG: TolB family protein [Planctomycetota bacterium]